MRPEVKAEISGLNSGVWLESVLLSSVLQENRKVRKIRALNSGLKLVGRLITGVLGLFLMYAI
jgi:hypothetical protein